MPSGSYAQVLVVCPFYRWDDGKKKIVCEGIVDNSSIALVYRNRLDYGIQMDTFCCKLYRNCEIYRMLMDKYEDCPLPEPGRKMNRQKTRQAPKRFEQQICLFDMDLPLE